MKKKKERPTLKLDDDPLFSEWSRATPYATPAGESSQAHVAPSFAPAELGFEEAFEEEEDPFARVPPERRERLQRYVMGTVAGCVALCLAAVVRVGVSRPSAAEDDAAVAIASAAAAARAATESTAAAPLAQLQGPQRSTEPDVPPPSAVEEPEAAEPAPPSSSPGASSSAAGPAAAAVEPSQTEATSMPTSVSSTPNHVASSVDAAQIPAAAAPPREETAATPGPVVAAAAPAATPARASTSPSKEGTQGAANPSAAQAKAGPASAATEIAPRTAVQERELARRALEHGKFRDAVAAAEQAAKLDPSDAEAWLILGAARQELGQAAAAHTAFRSCVQSAKHGPIGECRAMLH